MMEMNKIYEGCSLDVLKTFDDNTIDCCVTSPPYFGLRNYGVKKTLWPSVTYYLFWFEITIPEMECCLGLEPTPEAYIGHMILIFREVYRVIKKEGTLWLNISDTYAAYWGDKYGKAQSFSQARDNIGNAPPSKPSPVFSKSKRDVKRYSGGNVPAHGDVKPKDLFGIPWMLAFALRADGWYLRQDIIWSKPNPMPESVADRCTKSHEYIFLLSKSAKYYYDAFAIATPYQDKTLTTFGCEVKGNGDGSGLVQSENWASSIETRKPKVWKNPDGWDTGKGSHGTIHREGRQKGKTSKEKIAEDYGLNGNGFKGHCDNYDSEGNLLGSGKANKRSVWNVTTMPYKEAHFATFPQDLIVDCIKAGCPENGVVLDPFMGAGTTGLVARKLHRNFVGIELNPAYVMLAEKRLKKELGMFL